jgi:hypothetical protein
VVDVELITWALGTGTALLSQTPLMSDARPAFLLDARRSTTLGAGEPGRYDNRWVVLPQDFPSAAFLLSRRIREVALIQHGFLSPAEDLSHVLVRWQHAGIRLRLIDLMTGEFEPNATLKQPSHFRRAWYVAIALRGLRRSTVGGFGSTIPEQTARSGFYG